MHKNKKNIYCLLVILLLPTVLYAKSTYNKYLTTFNEGKIYYLAGNYTEAKNLLGEVIKGSCPKIDSIIPYAQFYYALAAYHRQEKELSIATFSAIMTSSPTWSQLDEVYYWLGKIKLEQGNYLAALHDLAKINTKSIKKDVVKMERYFLSQIDDTTQLQELLDKLPNHSSITNVLFSKAVSHAFISQYFTLVNQLKAKYNIDELIYKPLDDLRSKKKKSYNVAVFLPFFVDEIIDNSVINNEFIMEFYQGLQLGQERLAADGIVINLVAYDTQKDAATTSMLLKQKDMQKIDLIIGPIYPETIPIMADFSKRHAINMFNPFSNNLGAIANNPFGFLLQPSLATQGEKAAAFTLQSIANGRQDSEENEVHRDCIGVFYGTSQEDVTQANSYQQFIAANSDKEVDYILQMDDDEAKGFIEQYKKNKDVFIDSMEGLTHVYIASKNDLIVANVLTLFAMMDIHPYIIGHEDWVKKQLVGIDQACNKQLRFLAPNYINYDNDELHHFRELFFNRAGCYPQHESRHFAHIGYDMMNFLGKMLYKHGKYFQKYWDKEIYKPLIFAGFSYGSHHSNQYVPIIQLDQGKFAICNADS